MSTDLFLIAKYWTHNKKQLFKLLLSIIILTAIIVVANLFEITECRRKYDNIKHMHNACNFIFKNFSNEDYEIAAKYPETDKIARVFIYGKLGVQNISFTYGCYENKLAEALDYLELSYGRLPEKSGEAAIYDYALLEMFPNKDIKELLGTEIELSDNDLNGNNIGVRKLKIVGIIKNYNTRDLIEACQWWDKQLIPVPMPMIFLSSDDLITTPPAYNFTLITHTLSDFETQEAKDLEYKYRLKCEKDFKTYAVGSNGLAAATSGIMDYQAGNKMYEKVYYSDTTALIRYFCIIAVIISAISLFGVLYSIISERIKSLKLIKTLGYSNLKLIRLIISECIILYLTGFIFGIIIGYSFYEFVLFLQKNIWHLSALQALNAEWAVKQVTIEPFSTAFISSILTFILGYIIFIVNAFLIDRKTRRNNRKCRSFRKIKRIISGDIFTNTVQIISFTLIIITITLFYSFYTLNGKGNANPYLTRPELNGDSYYQYGQINMKKENIDVCIYSEYGEKTIGPVGASNNGIPKDTLRAMETNDNIGAIYAYGVNYAGNIVYSDGNDNVPKLIDKLKIQFDENQRNIYDTQIDSYYQLPMVFCNEPAVERLSEYIVDGKIGTYSNGVTLVLPQYNSSFIPYGIGDEISMIAFNSDGWNQNVLEKRKYTVKVEAIVLLPSSLSENDILSNTFLYNDYYGISLICTPEFEIETYNNNYDFIYIKSTDSRYVDKITNELRSLLTPSMHVRIKNINECTKDFNRSRIEQYLSVVIIMIMLFIMMIIGYYSLISLKIQINHKKVSLLRALGVTHKESCLMFIRNNLKNTLIACTISGLTIFYLIHLIKEKYAEAVKLIDKYGYIGADNNAAVTELQNRYFLDYEIHNAPAIPFWAFISIIMIIISLASAYVASKSTFNNNICSDLEEKERE